MLVLHLSEDQKHDSKLMLVLLHVSWMCKKVADIVAIETLRNHCVCA